MQIPNGAMTALWATPLFQSDGIANDSDASGTDAPAALGASFDAELLMLESCEHPTPSILPAVQEKSSPRAEANPVTEAKPHQQGDSAPAPRQPTPQDAPMTPRLTAGSQLIQSDLPAKPESPERAIEGFVAEKKPGHPTGKQAEPRHVPPVFWRDPPALGERSNTIRQATKPAHPDNMPKNDPMVAAAPDDLSFSADFNGLAKEVASAPEEIEPSETPQPLERLPSAAAKPAATYSDAPKSDIRSAHESEVPPTTIAPTRDLPPAQAIEVESASEPQRDADGLAHAPKKQFITQAAEQPAQEGETRPALDLAPSADTTNTKPIERRVLAATPAKVGAGVMATSPQPKQGSGPVDASSPPPRAVVSGTAQNSDQPRAKAPEAPVENPLPQKTPVTAEIAPVATAPDTRAAPAPHQAASAKVVDADPANKVDVADAAQGNTHARLATSSRPPPTAEPQPIHAQKADPVPENDRAEPGLSVQARGKAEPSTTVTTAAQVEPPLAPYRLSSPQMAVQTDTPVSTDIMGLADPGRPMTSTQITSVPVSGHASLPPHGAELHAARSQILATIHQSAAPDGPPRTEIILSPEELGKVHIHITGQDDNLQVRLFVERPETLDLLRRQGDILAQELRQSGLSHANLSFGDWRQQEQRSDNRNPQAKAHAFVTTGAEPVTRQGPRLIEAGRLHLRL